MPEINIQHSTEHYEASREEMQNAFYTISHHHFLWIMHNTSSKAKHIRDSLASVWIRPPLPSVALQLQGIDLSDCSWFSPALFIQDAVSYILPLIHIECSILGQHLTEATRMTWHVGGYSLTVGTFILVAGNGDWYRSKRILLLGWVWLGVCSIVVGCSAVFSDNPS
jgi:hypothetical protein